MHPPADFPIRRLVAEQRGGSLSTLLPGSVLLTATLRWPIASRLAMAFADLGCRVEVLCPFGHPVALTHAAARIHRHRVLWPLTSLRAAMEACKPDIVVPCDDDAARLLYRLQGEGSAGTWQATIERSLGSPGAFGVAMCRARLMAAAVEAGIRTPNNATLPDAAALSAWLAANPLPAVLKTEGTWGGLGVTLVRSATEAMRAYERMTQRRPIGRAIVRALLDRELLTQACALRAPVPAITVQSFVEGRPANRAIACWQGRVIAGTSVEALETQHATGPATVVRVIDNLEMERSASVLAERLGLSGLWGFDFIIESSTGQAHLIELNPRATPICHLVLRSGNDLPAALVAQMRGVVPRSACTPIANPVVALFPGEWQRDPASAHLCAAHHDVPWSEPGLVLDGVKPPWAERGWAARSWRLLRTGFAAADRADGSRPAFTFSSPTSTAPAEKVRAPSNRRSVPPTRTSSTE